MKTITITATAFKAHCLKLMEGRAQVVITKRGKVVARLTPEAPARETMRGVDRGKVREVADIVNFSIGEWEMD